MACDIVDPLPRTQAGFRYILTAMCLGTRCPFTIPLKRVDAQTVAKALMEVFSNTGIPAELLHDQGQVFMGKVTSTLCGLFNIKQLKTTAYHPKQMAFWRGGMVALGNVKEAGEGTEGVGPSLEVLSFSLQSHPSCCYTFLTL